MQIEPLYKPSNCSSAYQLNWSLSLFGKDYLPSPKEMFSALNQALINDRIRILDVLYREPNVVQFWVSTAPQVAPFQIVRLVKARWAYLSRASQPLRFRRNYRVASVGDAKAGILDAYVRRQPWRHEQADARLQADIEALQWHDRKLDVTAVQRRSHGEFVHGLHIVLELDTDWLSKERETLFAYRQSILASCRKHNWQPARIGLLVDHLHVLVVAGIADAPQDVALTLLNNLAFTQNMRPVFRFSFYVGTLGGFDRGAMRNRLLHARSSRPDKPDGEPL